MVISACLVDQLFLIGGDVEIFVVGVSRIQLNTDPEDVVHFVGATLLFSIGSLGIVGPVRHNAFNAGIISVNIDCPRLWPLINEYHRHLHTYGVVVGR